MLELITRSHDRVLTEHLPLLDPGEVVVNLDLIEGHSVASLDAVSVPDCSAAIVVRLHRLTPSLGHALTNAAARLRHGGRLIVLTRVSSADTHDRAMMSSHTPLAEHLLTVVCGLPQTTMRRSLRRHPHLDAWEGDCRTVAETLFTLVDVGEQLDQADLIRRSAAARDLPSMIAIKLALARAMTDRHVGVRLIYASTYTSHEFLDRTNAQFGVFAADGLHGYLPWTPADMAILVLERS